MIFKVGAKVSWVLGVVLGSLDEVLVHDPHQGLVVVEAEFVEQRLPDLVDVAHHHAGEEDLGERHHGVQRRLDRGLEELACVVVEEEAAGDDAGEHDDGPEDAPVHVGVGLGVGLSGGGGGELGGRVVGVSGPAPAWLAWRAGAQCLRFWAANK